MTSWLYYCDGSNSHAQGKGPAGAAFVCYIDQRVVNKQTILLAQGTNNQAELEALAAAVEDFCANAPLECQGHFHSDSQWSVYTLAHKLHLPGKPTYTTEHYPQLFDRIIRLWDPQRMTLTWVPREQNQTADQLAGKARREALQKFAG